MIAVSYTTIEAKCLQRLKLFGIHVLYCVFFLLVYSNAFNRKTVRLTTRLINSLFAYLLLIIHYNALA